MASSILKLELEFRVRRSAALSAGERELSPGPVRPLTPDLALLPAEHQWPVWTLGPGASLERAEDLLIIADGYAAEVLNVTPEDVFVGSPPLAFTFGLGGLAVFPLRFGATATLLETASPPNMIDIIETYKKKR